MARSSTSWKPGQTGNPNGAPVKSRALTAVLEKAGATRMDVLGRETKIARKRVLADQIWELLTVGRVTLGEKILEVADIGEWFFILKWLYNHIDGPAPKTVDVTSAGGAVGGLSFTELVALMQQADDELEAGEGPADE